MSKPQCPLWPELVHILCRECGVDENILPKGKSNRLSYLAMEAKRKEPAKFRSTLFDCCGSSEPLARQYTLASAPFRGFVNLNYDILLSNALDFFNNQDRGNVYPYPHLPIPPLGDPDVPFSPLKFRPIFHLHGKLPNKGEALRIVLTKYEYDIAYNDTLLPSFMTQLLTLFPTCFLGCSLSEDDDQLKRIIKLCDNIRCDLAKVSGNKPYPIYMLNDEAEHNDVELYLADYGITSVSYENGDGDYKNLDCIIKDWAGIQSAKIRSPYDRTATELYDFEEGPRND